MNTTPAPLSVLARAVAVLAVTAIALGLLVPTADAASSGIDAGGERALWKMLNAERTGRGLHPLKLSESATAVARDWSATMGRQERLYHRPDLAAPFTGRWTRLGENVAYTGSGYGIEVVHEILMNSPRHRDNILKRDFAWVGVGVVETGGDRWVTFNFGAGSDQVAGKFDQASGNGRFADVASGHTFARNIDWLAEAGITRGCNPPANARFCPDQAVTRGQMAAFLQRALNLKASNGRFADVPRGHTFREPIAALAGAGITKGCNPPANTRFCPDAPVTRGQMAAFLQRALDLKAANGRFADVPNGHTFRAPIAALADAGITKGCNPPNNTRFCPDAPVTRGQMAAFLQRALG